MKSNLSPEQAYNSLNITGVLMTKPIYKRTERANREYLQLLVAVNYKEENRNGVLYPAQSKFLAIFWNPEIIDLARSKNLKNKTRVIIEGSVPTKKIKSSKYPKSDVLMFKGRSLEVDNFVQTAIDNADIKNRFLNKIRERRGYEL